MLETKLQPLHKLLCRLGKWQTEPSHRQCTLQFKLTLMHADKIHMNTTVIDLHAMMQLQ